MDKAIINHENKIFGELQKKIQEAVDSGKFVLDFKIILSKYLKDKFKEEGFHTRPLTENGKIIGCRIWKRGK